MDEPAFLRAIRDAPDDLAPRLVYADWLDERGDPRAEFVRVQVRLREISYTHPDYEPLRVRERGLRLVCPPEWMARLDPPVWCVVGNIVNERPTKHGGIARGTREFGPNTKVYLAGIRNASALLHPQPDRHQYVEVVGRGRQDRRWVYRLVAVPMTRGWRVRRIADPALVMLRQVGWRGFSLPQSFHLPEDASREEAIRRLFTAIGVPQEQPT